MIRGLCLIPKSNRKISSRKCNILSVVCFNYLDCTFKARRPVSTPSYYRLGSVLLQLSVSGSVALLVSLFVCAYLTDTDFDALHQRCDGQTFTNFTNEALFFISPNESSCRFSFKLCYFVNITNMQCLFCICSRRPFFN